MYTELFAYDIHTGNYCYVHPAGREEKGGPSARLKGDFGFYGSSTPDCCGVSMALSVLPKKYCSRMALATLTA